jgi:hypothetical protein
MAQEPQGEGDWLGHNRHGTSPIVIVAMSAGMVMLYALTGVLVLIAGVLLWSKHSTEGFALVKSDWGVLAVMAVLAALCLVLAIKIRRELLKPRPGQ